MSNYILSIDLDPETNEYILTFPPELLEELGWIEGDNLIWSINDDNTVTLNKETTK